MLDFGRIFSFSTKILCVWIIHMISESQYNEHKWFCSCVCFVLFFNGQCSFLPQMKDVQLKIKFYTKDYVTKSLPRSFRGRLIHLSCLAILCEKFHDIMGCVATPEKGVVKFGEGDKELFVSSVSVYCSFFFYHSLIFVIEIWLVHYI